MANNSYTGNSVLDSLLAQRQQQNGFSMFNPNDAYMSFTSQVANTPNWWESLARAATAPLFMTGLRMYNKYSNRKDNTDSPNAGINSDAIRKGVTAAADKEFGIPNFLANLGLNYNDPYGNTFSPTEQPWAVDVNERLNPSSKWNNPLLAGLSKNPLGLGYSNFNVSNTPTTPTTNSQNQTTNNTAGYTAPSNYTLNYPYKNNFSFTPTLGFGNYQF